MTTQLVNAKMPPSVRTDTGKKQYEDALAYSKNLASNRNAVTDLIEQTDVNIHDISFNDPKLASYRVPEFFLGKVFQSLESTGPLVKQSELRMIDFTHTGGSLFVRFAASFSSPLSDSPHPPNESRCISAEPNKCTNVIAPFVDIDASSASVPLHMSDALTGNTATVMKT